jgi:hypothetical protein
MSHLVGLQLALLLVTACVANGAIEEGQPCPCAPGWTCDEQRQVCVRGGVDGGVVDGGSDGVAGGGGGTGTSACEAAVAPARLPVARTLIGAAAADDGRIFLVGGATQAEGVGEPPTALSVYDPATNSYRDLSPSPVAFSGWPSAVVVGSVLVVNDGDTLRYDIASDTWAAAAPAPVALVDRGAVAVGGQVHFFGGLGDTGGSAAYADVYDVAADTWAPLDGPPLYDEVVVAAHAGGRTYLVGTAVMAVNDDGSGWGTLPSPSTGLSWMGAATDHNGRLLVFGGYADPPGEISGATEIYDPGTNLWTTGARLKVPVLEMGTAVGCGGDAIFLFGGDSSTTGVTAKVQRYMPATDTWSTSSN